ncbi:hypothetical protein TREMEDRAFT_64484 [Tremella mesenterica DSM 1558]|uniref:uncharacterized protein n=1 Tax=Tremella mesenterica (strain ATCC 24925 / CBS 8224 / DSM 1558 / NBRC 9311 / NRRL Y-6157 / RJB 2259-6 / UBC 559-6) TaxID=578456 RepID=UPI0003F4985A|nr:uncharacterized protein TREMEDRAFT_64484 [Tremella mesenterica DSM 1558]EIW67235.1 hypothetical protein TREMEDRAFT_64484 [Tremella mesenterica DSM 1558]
MPRAKVNTRKAESDSDPSTPPVHKSKSRSTRSRPSHLRSKPKKSNHSSDSSDWSSTSDSGSDLDNQTAPDEDQVRDQGKKGKRSKVAIDDLKKMKKEDLIAVIKELKGSSSPEEEDPEPEERASELVKSLKGPMMQRLNLPVETLNQIWEEEKIALKGRLETFDTVNLLSQVQRWHDTEKNCSDDLKTQWDLTYAEVKKQMLDSLSCWREAKALQAEQEAALKEFIPKWNAMRERQKKEFEEIQTKLEKSKIKIAAKMSKCTDMEKIEHDIQLSQQAVLQKMQRGR